MFAANLAKDHGIHDERVEIKKRKLSNNLSNRGNRFSGDTHTKVRSLSESINHEQKKQYNLLMNKNLRRERSLLSHTRYNKMKNIIIKEVEDAIPEADHEPTATIFETNLQASIIV